MTYQQNQLPPPSNGLGVAGFIVSLVGLVLTCGILCPIGLILSLIALFRRPRGMALAGTVLGLIGTIVPLVLVLLYGVAVFSVFSIFSIFSTAIKQETQTQAEIRAAEVRIISYDTTLHTLPSDTVGNHLIVSLQDGYGHPLRYKRLTAAQFEIRSAGRDGVWDNSDDRFERSTATGTTLPASTPTEP